MNLDQMIGRYLRLKEELAGAYSTIPWNVPRIDRLAREIASTEHAIHALRSASHASIPPQQHRPAAPGARAERRAA